MKVVRFSEPPNPDGFVVLYLRPKDLFLFLGYWAGYERSVAAGQWTRDGTEIRLVGRGHLQTDTIPSPEGGGFERTLMVEDDNRTPRLTASEGLKGWSLLSWAGPFVYVGQHTVIDPDGCWLPNSLSAVDARIGEILGA